MSGGVCGSCGSGSEEGASFCWLCGYPLGTAAAGVPVQPVTPMHPQTGLAWVVAFLSALFVLSSVAVELALRWPGLLIPYAVMVVPVLAVLVRILYVQRLDFWEGPQTSEASTQSGIGRAHV